MLFVKGFLKNIRSYFSVEFATSHLYKVLVPSIGCFLLSSSFLPFKIKRMNELLFAYQFPKPILFASFWHTYYSTLCAICQEVFQKFLNFFSRLMYEILPRQTSHFTAVTRLSPCPLDIIIIAYFVLFVKRFFKSFWKIFSVRGSLITPEGLLPRALSASWHYYYSIQYGKKQDGIIHKDLQEKLLKLPIDSEFWSCGPYTTSSKSQ